MDYDVIIVGASFAGQSAAIQLARARLRLLVVDAKRPRNRFASSSHGFLGQDGRPPATIIADAAKQLEKYETVDLLEGSATSAAPCPGGFALSLKNAPDVTARRLILATGVQDILPELPGLRERWGVSVLHCPYCHGYELNKQPVGVLARNEAIAMHQAMLLPDWGPTTLFTQGAFTLSADQEAALTARGVSIEQAPVAALLGEGPALEAVRLADGRSIPLAGLFLAPQTRLASDLAQRLDCAIKEGPLGPLINVNERQQTSIPGVFAAGDAASPMANAALAAASGVLAAVGAHHSLIHGLEEKF